jgi:DNA polymerase-4
MERWVLHVDMDEFFAAIERLDDPSLRGKPILVGGSAEGRGVVSAASYEARRFGCHSAMSMAQARRLCPRAVVLPVRGYRYSEISRQVFEIFHRFTPRVQPLSIDEAFLDMTGSERLFGAAVSAARNIKTVIHEELGLVASVGVAPNMFLAKLASDLDKPDGLTVIEPGRTHDVLDPLPIRKLWGVGPAAETKLHRIGVKTIGDLRRMPTAHLQPYFGNQAEGLLALANGRDDREVTPDGQAKSIGQEETFPVDLADREELQRILLGQVQEVARRLRWAELQARTITLKIRDGEFNTISRSKTLADPTDVTEDLWQTSRYLFHEWAGSSFRPLRLLGMTGGGLSPLAGRQLSLFQQPDREKRRTLDATLDQITQKFGPGVIGRAGGISRKKS